MGDIKDLMRKLEAIASKADRISFSEATPEELSDKLMLPPPPLAPVGPKLHPTREEAEKRDKDKEYDEAMTEAEQKSEQLKKWLVE